MAVAFFFLTFFFMIPIVFVQSLANLEGIVKAAPFLKPIIEVYELFSLQLLTIILFYPLVEKCAALPVCVFFHVTQN